MKIASVFLLKDRSGLPESFLLCNLYPFKPFDHRARLIAISGLVSLALLARITMEAVILVGNGDRASLTKLYSLAAMEFFDLIVFTLRILAI